MAEYLSFGTAGQEGVTEHPLLMETSAGVIGGTITAPLGPSEASLAILVGLTEERSGANSFWRSMARAIAGTGVTVLRADSPGVSDAHLAEGGDLGDLATLELVRWFARTAGAGPLVIIGYCKGAQLGARLAMEDPAPAALGLIAPPPKLFGPPPTSGLARARAFAGRLRRRRARRGSGSGADHVGLLKRVPARTPTWVLIGSDDRGAAGARELERRGRHRGRYALDYVEDVELHWLTTPSIQEEIMTRVTGWVQQVSASPAEARP